MFKKTTDHGAELHEPSGTVEQHLESDVSYLAPKVTKNNGTIDVAGGHTTPNRENRLTFKVDTDVPRGTPNFQVHKLNGNDRHAHSAREGRGRNKTHNQIPDPNGVSKPRRPVPGLRDLRENEAIVEGQVSAARFLPETVVKAMVRVSYHSSSPASTSSHIHTLFRCRASKHETESANCVSGGCQWVDRQFQFIMPMHQIIHERNDGEIEFTLYHIRDNGVRQRVGSCALRMLTCLVPETEADLPLHTCLRWRPISAGTGYRQSDLCVAARVVARGDVRQRVQEHVLQYEAGEGVPGRESQRQHAGRESQRQHAGRESERQHAGRESQRQHAGRESQRQHPTASARHKPRPAPSAKDRRHLAHHSRIRKKHEGKEIRRQNRKLDSRISAHERQRRRKPSTFSHNPKAVEGFLNAEEQRGCIWACVKPCGYGGCEAKERAMGVSVRVSMHVYCVFRVNLMSQ